MFPHDLVSDFTFSDRIKKVMFSFQTLYLKALSVHLVKVLSFLPFIVNNFPRVAREQSVSKRYTHI